VKIGIALDAREAADRREIFQNKVAEGNWYACVASTDLRYFVPIIKSAGRYCTSLPRAFVNLGIKQRNKKFFSAARGEAERMILRAAAILGADPPLLTIFGPAAERRTIQRTRNRLAKDRSGSTRPDFPVNPKVLRGSWSFSPAFHWLREIPGITER
jgi:hypothetical protein